MKKIFNKIVNSQQLLDELRTNGYNGVVNITTDGKTYADIETDTDVTPIVNNHTPQPKIDEKLQFANATASEKINLIAKKLGLM